jgi:diadenosine tetraphosphatase ApaH/serine/threonine PP2A family protein phosphatase
MGHSHIPYYRIVDGIHFINPGSVGRMFDGDPRTSFAILKISSEKIAVEHFRIPYAVEAIVKSLKEQNLPDIYAKMFRAGKKLN